MSGYMNIPPTGAYGGYNPAVGGAQYASYMPGQHQPQGYGMVPHPQQFQQQQQHYPQGYAVNRPMPAAAGYPVGGPVYHQHVGGAAPMGRPLPAAVNQQHSHHPHQQHIVTSPTTAAAPSSKPPVSIGWVRSIAKGAVSLDGTALASCVDYTQLPSFLTLPPAIVNLMGNSAMPEYQKRQAAAAEVTTFMGWLRHALVNEVGTAAVQEGATEAATAAAKRYVEPFIALAGSVFVLQVAKMFQPPTAAAAGGASAAVAEGAVDDGSAGAHRKKGKKSNKSGAGGASGSGADGVDITDLTLILEGCTNATRNIYLKSLMKAFDMLQALHIERRSSKNCNGYPGWDTAVVIGFVHVIQNLCQTIDEFEGEVMGDIIRNWRKLFVFLQTCDLDIANESSRRRGALAVVNSLLILLFQQDNTHQCRIILNSIESAEKMAEAQKDPLRSIVKSSSHLVAEMVKFRFYQGRIRLFDRNYEGAFAAFSEASRLLPPMPVPAAATTTSKKGKGAAAVSDLGAAETGPEHPLAMGTAPADTSAVAVAAFVAAAGTSASAQQPPMPAGMNASQRDNKLRVVFYQIAAAIVCNLRVAPSVLTTDPSAAKVFRPVIAALQNGSPAAFTIALDLHAAALRHRGVFMILQQARIYCYLVMLQKVHEAVTTSGKDNSMIPIGLLVEALAANNHGCCDSQSEGYLFAAEAGESAVVLAEGTDIPNNDVFRLVKKLRVEVDARSEKDDVILWIGRLIARGLVRGYLSYEHQMLVLSKKEPFPAPNYTFNLN